MKNLKLYIDGLKTIEGRCAGGKYSRYDYDNSYINHVCILVYFFFSVFFFLGFDLSSSVILS